MGGRRAFPVTSKGAPEAAGGGEALAAGARRGGG